MKLCCPECDSTLIKQIDGSVSETVYVCEDCAFEGTIDQFKSAPDDVDDEFSDDEDTTKGDDSLWPEESDDDY